MAVNIWQDGTKSIPMDGDSRIHRIKFPTSEIGARKSHITIGAKNENTIKHVKASG